MRFAIIAAIVVVILALIWVGWRIYRHRSEIRQNDPYRHLPRKERRRIALEDANLTLDQKRQAYRERVQRYIDDPNDPQAQVWKDLLK